MVPFFAYFSCFSILQFLANADGRFVRKKCSSRNFDFAKTTFQAKLENFVKEKIPSPAWPSTLWT
jgi:hypothetical protein